MKLSTTAHHIASLAGMFYKAGDKTPIELSEGVHIKSKWIFPGSLVEAVANVFTEKPYLLRYWIQYSEDCRSHTPHCLCYDDNGVLTLVKYVKPGSWEPEIGPPASEEVIVAVYAIKEVYRLQESVKET
jgi:hypothetical protein